MSQKVLNTRVSPRGWPPHGCPQGVDLHTRVPKGLRNTTPAFMLVSWHPPRDLHLCLLFYAFYFILDLKGFKIWTEVRSLIYCWCCAMIDWNYSLFHMFVKAFMLGCWEHIQSESEVSWDKPRVCAVAVLQWAALSLLHKGSIDYGPWAVFDLVRYRSAHVLLPHQTSAEQSQRQRPLTLKTHLFSVALDREALAS